MGHHIKGLVGRREAVSIAWLCDVDPAQIDKAARLIDGFQSAPPEADGPLRRRPRRQGRRRLHHRHAAPLARADRASAMRQGKDLYIEKPISHVYDEGPKIIAAAKKYGRVVQQGSQMRSSPVTREGRAAA